MLAKPRIEKPQLMMAKKIFIGSSKEALETANLVGKLVEETGLVPLKWNTAFPTGDILMERIEELPSEVEGVVLLVTPDVHCIRGKESFDGPIPNVVFEHGYMAARLGRRRVAICAFEGATIPTDLDGMKVVRAGKFQKDSPLPLPEDTAQELRQWLEQLPLLAGEMSPVHRVHGYSGTWKIETEFSRWRSMDLGEGEIVNFSGTAVLIIPIHGRNGSGTQIGELFVQAGDYKATYEIANRINSATITPEDGRLKLQVEVVTRKLTWKTGKPPDQRFRGELWGSRRFELDLEPVPEKPKCLRGVHRHELGLQADQLAKEKYEYLGL